MFSLKKLIKTILPPSFWEFLKKAYVKTLRCFRLDIQYFYGESFSTGPYRDKKWVDAFADLIIDEFHLSSIIDIGCGTGDILSAFQKRNIRILGVDGSKSNKKHSKIEEKSFLVHDLRVALKNKRNL